jgi:hypothetical protein
MLSKHWSLDSHYFCEEIDLISSFALGMDLKNGLLIHW